MLLETSNLHDSRRLETTGIIDYRVLRVDERGCSIKYYAPNDWVVMSRTVCQ